MKCTIYIDDEVSCRIGGLRPDHSELLWNRYGLFVEGYFHTPQYQLRRWDGKIRFFAKEGKTYTKLLHEIYPYLATWGYQYDVVDHRIPAVKIDTRISADFFNKPGWELRPYQVNVVNSLLEEGSGFALCATGAGKCLSGDTLLNIDVPDELAEIIHELQRVKQIKD